MQIKEEFTLDNRLSPAKFGVTKEKARYVKSLYEKARNGSRAAEGQLVELFTSSDAAHTIAHLINIDTIPQLPEELKDLETFAPVRKTKDFNPVYLLSLIGAAGVEGAGVDKNGAASIVPEGTRYPYVTVKSDQEAFYSKLAKRGVAFGWTFEAWINDLVGQIEAMPQELLALTKATAYAEVWEALLNANVELKSVTLPDGTTTTPNAPVSANALIAASVELSLREINGRKIGDKNDFIVHVPTGRKKFLEYDIAQFGRIKEIHEQDGSVTKVLAPDTAIQSLFPKIEIKETDFLTGTQWKLQPRPGTTNGRPVLERLSLRGYENPELRYRNDQGVALGGGQIGPFQGGFDTDTAEMRYRYITGGVLWDPTWIVSSKGDGSAAAG
jgi:hypothetical protein